MRLSIRNLVVAAAFLLGVVGLVLPTTSAGAASSPIQLLVPQSTAFSVLGYDCGGIAENAYATGFDSTIDPVAGYPTGDVFLTTTCSAGKGTDFTVSAWTSDTWDLTGALLSYSVLSTAPTPDPNFSATDASTGNQVYGTTNFHCTTQTSTVPSACLQLASGFTPRPRVTGISAIQGPATGGTAVTISGDGFTAATNVYFGTPGSPSGAIPAASVTVNSDTSITAVAPADTSGISPDSLDVTVVSPGGTSFTSAGDQFTFYMQPTVTRVSSNRGPIGGGYYVTVTGTNFVGRTLVMDGDTQTASQVINNTTLSVYIVPGEAAGDSMDIVVTSPGGASPVTPADQFTYNPPASVAVSPAKGLPGTPVKVRGANFASRETVTVAYLTGLPAPRPSRVVICTGTTTASGAFVCQGKIPTRVTGAKGVHSIVATGAVGDAASANFDLT
jgi:hypothetical protein